VGGGRSPPTTTAEPNWAFMRTRRMTSALSPRMFLLGAVIVAVSAAALLGGGGASPEGRPSSAAVGLDVGALVNDLSAGNSAAVVRRLEREIAVRPGDAALRTYLGLGYQQLFRETGDPSWLSRSRTALERAVELSSGRDPITLSGLAQLSATQHRFRDAERHARSALRLEPGNPTALGALGDALVELGRYDEAFAAYDRLAAQGPSVAGYARVARARELLGRPEAALEALELALEAGSGIPEQEAWALSRYGELLLGADIAAARDAFRHSLALSPSFPHAHAGLAKAEFAAGAPREAARMLEALLRRAPSAEYAAELGDIYRALGAKQLAAAAYQRAREFERALARHGVRTMLASATLDLDLGIRLRSALDRARLAYREAPNVETIDLMAWALERNGKCLAARAWSKRSFALGTRDAKLFFHRGMIERCLGRAEVAAGWFRQAVELDPAFSVRWGPTARRLAAA
jgi:tetratricopeptide (TPR) repeat protein